MDKRGEADARKQALKWADSDHLTLVKVYNQWRTKRGSEARAFCNENFVSWDTMRTIGDLRKDYASVLADIGFLPGRRPSQRRGKGSRSSSDYGHHGEMLPSLNACAARSTVLQAALVAGLAPNLLKLRRPAKFADVMGSAMQATATAREIKYYKLLDGMPARVFMHPSSVNFHQVCCVVLASPSMQVACMCRWSTQTQTRCGDVDEREALTVGHRVRITGRLQKPVLGVPYNRPHEQGTAPMIQLDTPDHMVLTDLLVPSVVVLVQVFVRDSSSVCPYALLMFGGPLHVQVMKRKIHVGPHKYFTLNAGPRVGVLIKRIRMALDELLTQKVADPGLDISDSRVIDGILMLLVTEGLAAPDMSVVRAR